MVQNTEESDNPCQVVVKRSNTTGLTVSRANVIFSHARDYYDDDKAKTSKESAKGDSGSVILDGRGRIGSLLTGGAGATSSSDITC